MIPCQIETHHTRQLPCLITGQRPAPKFLYESVSVLTPNQIRATEGVSPSTKISRRDYHRGALKFTMKVDPRNKIKLAPKACIFVKTAGISAVFGSMRMSNVTSVPGYGNAAVIQK